MNSKNLKLCSELVDKSFIELASNSLSSRENQITQLLEKKRLPEEGWDDLSIEHFLNNIALMDTNNFTKQVGVGQRESRIYSNIVAQRHFFMGHGIGRSGDVAATQPKAAGSSLIVKIAQFLVQDAIQLCQFKYIQDLILLPLATGMSLTMVLLCFKSLKPDAKYVIWPRIDQKTCLKCISTANLIPVVIEGVIKGDQVKTNLQAIQDKILELGKENVLCVLSTTSCFAPRVPDQIDQIAAICQNEGLFHLVNNAYGLMCQKISQKLNLANEIGRVDAVVQSTDKNFMVPVGGSVIFSKNADIIQKLSEIYPGRASAAPIVDIMITLLSMGQRGWVALQDERKKNFQLMINKLSDFGQQIGERVLHTPHNTISIGFTLTNLVQNFDKNSVGDKNEATLFGSLLYGRRVMGSRILSVQKKKKIGQVEFTNYGSNHNNYPILPYMTIACAIGMKLEQFDIFLEQFQSSLKDLMKKLKIDKNEESQILDKDKNQVLKKNVETVINKGGISLEKDGGQEQEKQNNDHSSTNKENKLKYQLFLDQKFIQQELNRLEMNLVSFERINYENIRKAFQIYDQAEIALAVKSKSEQDLAIESNIWNEQKADILKLLDIAEYIEKSAKIENMDQSKLLDLLQTLEILQNVYGKINAKDKFNYSQYGFQFEKVQEEQQVYQRLVQISQQKIESQLIKKNQFQITEVTRVLGSNPYTNSRIGRQEKSLMLFYGSRISELINIILSNFPVPHSQTCFDQRGIFLYQSLQEAILNSSEGYQEQVHYIFVCKIRDPQSQDPIISQNIRQKIQTRIIKIICLEVIYAAHIHSIIPLKSEKRFGQLASSKKIQTLVQILWYHKMKKTLNFQMLFSIKNQDFKIFSQRLNKYSTRVYNHCRNVQRMTL